MLFMCVLIAVLGTVIGDNSCQEADSTLVKYIKWQMKEKDQPTSCKCNNKKAEYVAFHAKLKGDLNDLPSNAVVKFNELLTNEGGAYDPNTGIFTCPIDGIYSFSWTLLTAPGKIFHSVLVAAGQTFAYSHLDASSISNHRSSSQSAVIKLKKGDAVMIRVYGQYGKHADESWSSFSGFKI